MLALFVASAAQAQAQDATGLVVLINDYRESAQRCDGQSVPPLGPLAPDDALARAATASGTPVQEALQAVGYQAASLQAIGIRGPASAAVAMAALKQRYCGLLLNPEYADIGVSRQGNSWQILLARPLLSEDLGDWQAAGREVLERINQARSQPRTCGDEAFAAAPALSWNPRLAEAALAHSRDMAYHNYFSHAGRDGSQASNRATRAGYVWRGIGENLAAGQGSPKQAVAGWLSSPGHCATLMSPDFSETGAAYVVNPESAAVIYWTQVFGAPR